MAVGYEHYDILRMIPVNGVDEVLDLQLAFTDFGGPTSTLPSYELISESREDINFNYRPNDHGYRMDVEIQFDIFDVSNEETIRRIMDRGRDPDWSFALSIDGGVTEHEVRLRRARGPEPHDSKTTAGSRWRLDFRRIALLDEIPASDPGAPTPVGLPAYLPAVWSLPTPSAAVAGYVYRLVTPGQPDEARICLGDGSGGYGWATWAFGGL